MEKITRQQFLDRLQNSWQPLVARFYGLAPQEQAAYLEKQGYAAFPDLLGHVIAWWQDGAAAIADLRKDPTLPLAEYDVDKFNAEAVKRFKPLSREEVIRAYENQRQVMVELVQSLPEAELNYANVNLRLYYEIIMHWTEHELK